MGMPGDGGACCTSCAASAEDQRSKSAYVRLSPAESRAVASDACCTRFKTSISRHCYTLPRASIGTGKQLDAALVLLRHFLVENGEQGFAAVTRARVNQQDFFTADFVQPGQEFIEMNMA